MNFMSPPKPSLNSARLINDPVEVYLKTPMFFTSLRGTERHV